MRLYMYTQADRQTDRQADRKTDREADREADILYLTWRVQQEHRYFQSWQPVCDEQSEGEGRDEKKG